MFKIKWFVKEKIMFQYDYLYSYYFINFNAIGIRWFDYIGEEPGKDHA